MLPESLNLQRRRDEVIGVIDEVLSLRGSGGRGINEGGDSDMGIKTLCLRPKR